MEAIPDKFTAEDLQGLRRLAHFERSRTEDVVVQVPNGTIVQGKETREIFRFEAPGEGVWIFDVRGIKDAIADKRIEALMLRVDDIPEDFYQHVLNNNGVEPERLPGIGAADLERPGIMVAWPNGYQTMIDGNHRMCCRWMLGKKSFRFIIVDVRDCAPHMCRPGGEDKLFLKDRPGMQVLHAEIRKADR